jgi:lipopolysaccharide/colanic/teichoic acid biosynthesis glycosyltransferase
MTLQEKSRYNELMRIAQYGDFMSSTEFDELLGLFKKLGK